MFVAHNQGIQLRSTHAFGCAFDRQPAIRLTLSPGVEHRRNDSNQDNCELNHHENWNDLVQDAHFNLSF